MLYEKLNILLQQEKLTHYNEYVTKMKTIENIDTAHDKLKQRTKNTFILY